jgi:hypothetical protein
MSFEDVIYASLQSGMALQGDKKQCMPRVPDPSKLAKFVRPNCNQATCCYQFDTIRTSQDGETFALCGPAKVPDDEAKDCVTGEEVVTAVNKMVLSNQCTAPNLKDTDPKNFLLGGKVDIRDGLRLQI